MADKPKVLLSIREVSKSFPGVKALDGVSLDVLEGEVHALLGENGSGKSTLVKCIVGAYHRDSGQIVFDGESVDFDTPAEAYAEGISVIYQERSLIPQLTVIENVLLGVEYGGRLGILDERRNKKRYRELSEEFGFELPEDKKVSELGVAEQKMVEIMKALIHSAKLIIMDEPTASLSEREVHHLFRIMGDLKKAGVTILYITHILDEVFKIADRITVLRDGKKVSTVKVENIDKDGLIDLMVGKSIKRVYVSGSSQVSKVPILEVRNLKRLPRVRDVSFKLYKDEVLGITGLTGAGKTEVARIIFGADRAEGGEILIDGKVCDIRSPVDAVNMGLALIPEDRKKDGLVLGLEVFKNFTLPTLKAFSKRGVLDIREEIDTMNVYKKRFDIKIASPVQIVRNLSGGNQQKLIISKWLHAKPRVFIMDEATQGIDVGAKGEIYSIVRELARSGVSIIFISSEIEEVTKVCDRILIMSDGRIIAEFPYGTSQDVILHTILRGTQKAQ